MLLFSRVLVQRSCSLNLIASIGLLWYCVYLLLNDPEVLPDEEASYQCLQPHDFLLVAILEGTHDLLHSSLLLGMLLRLHVFQEFLGIVVLFDLFAAKLLLIPH